MLIHLGYQSKGPNWLGSCLHIWGSAWLCWANVEQVLLTSGPFQLQRIYRGKGWMIMCGQCRGAVPKNNGYGTAIQAADCEIHPGSGLQWMMA